MYIFFVIYLFFSLDIYSTQPKNEYKSYNPKKRILQEYEYKSEGTTDNVDELENNLSIKKIKQSNDEDTKERFISYKRMYTSEITIMRTLFREIKQKIAFVAHDLHNSSNFFSTYDQSKNNIYIINTQLFIDCAQDLHKTLEHQKDSLENKVSQFNEYIKAGSFSLRTKKKYMHLTQAFIRTHYQTKTLLELVNSYLKSPLAWVHKIKMYQEEMQHYVEGKEVGELLNYIRKQEDKEEKQDAQAFIDFLEQLKEQYPESKQN